jgi:hypothetical protein
MKMTKAVLIISLMLIPSVRADDKPQDKTTAARFANALAETFANIIKSGSAVWDKLGEGQAIDTLQTLATDAATLETQKNDLRAELANGRIRDTSELSPRIDKLKASLREIKARLEKFSVEIDAAAHPIGEDLRIEVEKADTDKVFELDAMFQAFDREHPQPAI